MKNFWSVGSTNFARDISGQIAAWGANAVIYMEPAKERVEKIRQDRKKDAIAKHRVNSFNLDDDHFERSEGFNNTYFRIKTGTDNPNDREEITRKEWDAAKELFNERTGLKIDQEIDAEFGPYLAENDIYFVTVKQAQPEGNVYINWFWVKEN